MFCPNLQAKREWKACGPQPTPSSNEPLRTKSLSLSWTCNHLISFPFYPLRSPSTRPSILKLCIKQCIEGKIAIPLMPPSWINHVTNARLHNHSSRILLPWPPKKRLEASFHWLQIAAGTDPTLLDHYAGVLVRVEPALSRDRVLLARVGTPGLDGAVLEDDGGVAEDEVDGAGDEAVCEELAVVVDVEGVLVCKEVAAVEG